MAVAAAAGADVAEIRVDLLSAIEQPSWSRILTAKTLPVIVTNRACYEGGSAPPGEEARLSFLAEAASLGADFIDVELAAWGTFRAQYGASGVPAPTRLILSHHNFERALNAAEIRTVYSRMVGEDCDVCKIAMAGTAVDNATAFAALGEANERPMIMLVMGEVGLCSRVLTGKYGGFLTFASVGAGREAAPGQVDTRTLVEGYGFRSVGNKTKVFGVIGNPIKQSMSPALHNAAFRDAGFDAVYVPLKVEGDIAVFIRTMVMQGFSGFSVTIPGKVCALEAVDDVEEVTRKIGAMNTVVVSDTGELVGYNTDWVAAISAIEEGLAADGRDMTGAKVLCIGAGGAGRGLAYGALARGAKEVVIINRTMAKAEALAADIGEGARVGILEDVAAGSEGKFDVVMNTTSIGMQPEVGFSPVPGGAGAMERMGHPLVFDAVYNPLETLLLKDARNAGCVCVSGVEMFVRQAAEQFRLWFPDTPPNVELMRAVVMAKL